MKQEKRPSHPPSSKLLLTTPEAAVALRLSVITMKRLRTSRRGPAYVRLGRLVRYRIGDLRRWINANRVVSLEVKFRTRSGVAAS